MPSTRTKTKVAKPSPSELGSPKRKEKMRGKNVFDKTGDAKRRRKPSAPKGQSQSCHQCRQSIHSSKGVFEVKSGKERLKCSQCTRYW